MKPDRKNIESYLLDLQEGRLNDAEAQAVFQFLESNPDLMPLWDALCETDTDAFDAAYLKKQISDDELIEYTEGLLSEDRKRWIENECYENSSLAHDLKLYRNTVVKPDVHVVFENKSELYKEAKPVPLFIFRKEVWASAAAILILFSFYFLYKNSGIDTFQKRNRQARFVRPVFTEEPIAKVEVNNTIKSIQNSSVNTAFFKKEIKKRNLVKFELPFINSNIRSDSVNLTKSNSTDANASDALQQIELPLPSLPSVQNQERVAYYPVEMENDFYTQSSKPARKTKNFWSVASGLLRNIKILGAKNVDVKEKEVDERTQYTFVLGNFSLTKTK